MGVVGVGLVGVLVVDERLGKGGIVGDPDASEVVLGDGVVNARRGVGEE